MQKNPFKKNVNFYVGIAGNIFEGLLSGGLFIVLYYVIDSLWNQNFNMLFAIQLTLILGAIFILRIIIYSYGYTKAQLGGAEVSKNIRLFLGDKIKRIPLKKFNKNQAGDYINVCTSDINAYENILTHKIGDLAKNISLSIMIIMFVSNLYLKAGMILTVAELLLIPTLLISFHIVKKYGTKKNEICSESVSSIIEYVGGIQTFRAYGVAGNKNKNVVNAMKNFSDISYIYEAKVIPLGMLLGLIVWLSCPLIIYVGYDAIRTEIIDVITYLLVIMLPIFLGKLIMTIFIDLTSYKNLKISRNKILNIVNEEEDMGQAIDIVSDHHNISFENVNFSYIRGENVLKNASFEIPDQKLTAIVGDSGSGKSTILNLIAKYYEVDSGDIKIGGQSITNIKAENVLKYISMVDQDVFLFDDSVKENIRHARIDAKDEEIVEACKQANCHEFIMKMEYGYDTQIGENGNLLSGGERQRLSIARAILKNSPILLLDEATASLDIDNELAVKLAIGNLLKSKKTVVMIAHTLSIIKNADKILVVDDGRIIEKGDHESLLHQNGKYAAMWNAEQKIIQS